MLITSQVGDRKRKNTIIFRWLDKLRDRWSRIRLQTRLLVLITFISVLILSAVVGALYNRTSGMILELSKDQLSKVNSGVGETVSQWLKLNVESLAGLVDMPEIRSMEGDRQRSILEAMDKAYEHIYLIHTIDWKGMDTARSDGAEKTSYLDQAYVQIALTGKPIVFQSQVGRTTNLPGLILTSPIRTENDKVVGVASFATDMDDLSRSVENSAIGETGFAYIVDAKNRVLIHPDPTYTSKMQDLSGYPPVLFLRLGGNGYYEFRDDNGQEWISYVDVLDYGWGVIVQQKKNELFAALLPVRVIAVLIFVLGIFTLYVLSRLAIQSSLRPIQELRDAAVAVASGDLSRRVGVRRKDETGQLAESFNSMTDQLQGMVGSLENQVAERTQSLEASFQVAQRLATMLDQDELVLAVVNEVKKAFGFYHVHVYLLDKARENLVMVGGSGEAGEIMLRRNHKIPYGKGLVGRSAETGQVVLVQDTSNDPGWLPNPLLPETLSEVAVPISSANNILGVLDVQHNVIHGFTDQQVELLQTIANQTAVAVQNSRLYNMAKRQAENEMKSNMIVGKVQSAVTLEAVLQTALRELSETLGATRASIQVKLKPDDGNGHRRS